MDHDLKSDIRIEGNTAEVESKKLKELRDLLQLDVNEAFSDNDCLRFLKARCYDPQKSADMIVARWEWWNTPLLPEINGRKLTPRNILLCGDIITFPKQEYVDKYLPHVRKISFMSIQK